MRGGVIVEENTELHGKPCPTYHIHYLGVVKKRREAGESELQQRAERNWQRGSCTTGQQQQRHEQRQTHHN